MTVFLKDKVSYFLRQFTESIVDKGNLFHSIVLLCSKEATLNVGRLKDNAFLNCKIKLSSIEFCYEIYRITEGKLLIHCWLLNSIEFQYDGESHSVTTN